MGDRVMCRGVRSLSTVYLSVCRCTELHTSQMLVTGRNFLVSVETSCEGTGRVKDRPTRVLFCREIIGVLGSVSGKSDDFFLESSRLGPSSVLVFR